MYSLVEMLLVVAIFGFLLNAATLLFVDGSRICRDAIRDADFIRTVSILRGEWRKFIKDSKGIFQTEGNVLGSDSGNFAKFADGRIFLQSPRGTRGFILPKGCSARFFSEDGALAPCAVLELSYGKNIKRRIVAAYEEKK